ncbi:hypothetical protein Q5Y73_24640 [Chengkuizengella sp. 2205SS18-9]|uniref:Uncharacterized protein n=2 Tax=Chengkuizengella axinellae TaxID=3064388 RepID=A0ABT9J718_9BACL|nr:hypothetical protein [Chengkuizengella sp. 2205SS18-9]MDP5277273.1 hypothetical protein [Chengkuizengella sp. 2205SS18-9]
MKQLTKEDKQAVLDVLNSFEVYEECLIDGYILVENNEENRKRLNDVGVTDKEIDNVADKDFFCTIALAFNGGYADNYEIGKFILWDPIDDELKERVREFKGTETDALRLLEALEKAEGVKEVV